MEQVEKSVVTSRTDGDGTRTRTGAKVDWESSCELVQVVELALVKSP